VGPRGTARLEATGIHTIGDLQDASFAALKLEFGSWALDLQRKARGQDSGLVETEREAKSISRETTFVKDVGDLAQLKRVLLSLSEDVGHDLRSEGLQAKTIAIKLRWPSFQTITRQTTLTRPTDSTSEIYQAAASLLTAAVKRGVKVRLLGVRATNLAGGRQLDFFDMGSEKRARLEKAVDGIRDRFGEKAIRRAALIRKRGPHPEF
jgi:DNA polymerase-4